MKKGRNAYSQLLTKVALEGRGLYPVSWSNESIVSENLQSTAGKIFADCGGSSCRPQTVPN
ncbi:hypothetical protein [Microcoleus sp. F4-D5]|uniref:hypothetical protein n=1 Tax=Microcoleus sp. F4-D5 TaxID=2818760 RepID=UPI002FD3D35D